MIIKELEQIFKENNLKRLSEVSGISANTLKQQRHRLKNDNLTIDKQIEILNALDFEVEITVG